MTRASGLDRSARWLSLAVLVLACGASQGAAQVVQGRLLDSATKNPILVGRIALLDTTLAILDQTYANESGVFTLNAPHPGAYYIAADRAGYVPRIDGVLDLGAGGSITIEFYLKPRPVDLAGLSVLANEGEVDRYLNSVGFSERKDQGSAFIMTRETVEQSGAATVAMLLRRAPGAFVRDQGGATTLLFRGGSVPATAASAGIDRPDGTRAMDPTGFCTPRIIVNGAPVDAVTAGIPGAMIDGVVGIEEIIGVEVHSGPASLPLQFSGTGSDCTTVLFWTRRGGGDADGDISESAH